MWLAWSLWALSLALATLALPLQYTSDPSQLLGRFLYALVFLVFATVGAFVASCKPDNPIGWLFCAVGLLNVLWAFALPYATYALVTRPDSLPGGKVMAWLATGWTATLGWGLLAVFVPLLFPTGPLVSEIWRRVAWVAAGVLALSVVTLAFTPGQVAEDLPIENPVGLESAAPAFELAPMVLMPALMVITAASAISLIIRFRRSIGVERQQLKWFAYSIALLASVIVLGFLTNLGPVTVPESALTVIHTSGLLAVPVAMGVAILKYRLWDIDVIINRTLVYGALTAVVVGLYILVVGGLGALLQARGNLLLSLLATGLVAILFAPLRDRLQRGVNRLMYGERDDPYSVVSRLGQRLEGTLEPQAVLPSVVQTVREGLKLPYVAVALQRDGEYRIAAVSGSPVMDPLHLALMYQGEQVGELILGPRTGEGVFGPTDRRLLEDLARQVGVAVHAVHLTADLQRSRERLVSAREEERRRLRHDLHDGLGPALASMSLQLAAVRNLVAENPAAVEMITDLKAQMQEAVADIRRLVYALRPPALDELGLAQAIREYAARLTQTGLKIRVEAPEPLPPLPAAVEVAAYRIVLEALTNAVRHAGARTCAIRVAVVDGGSDPVQRRSARALQAEILDDGSGIHSRSSTGTGLISMRERASELGGTLVVEPVPDGGTRVCARLPLGDSDG